jgi:6-phosphogluconolactonase
MRRETVTEEKSMSLLLDKGRGLRRSWAGIFYLLLPTLLLCVVAPVSHAASDASRMGGFVYVMTNQPAGNTVIQYERARDGSLTKKEEAATGGLGGTGNGVGAVDPLGSQDSLILTGSGSVLLAVNAGSDSVSSLAAGAGGVALRSQVASGGSFPNSVAVHGSLVYVLNARSPNIAGFRLDSSGMLTPIPGAVFPVPGGAAAKPHDIRFSPDGTRVLVSVEGTNELDIFALDNDGLVTEVTRQPAAGMAPFGFAFGRGGVLISTEAASGSVSTYELTGDDTLEVISAAIPSTQAATCWVSLTSDGKFAFVSNTASGTLSTYHVGRHGILNLEKPVAASIDGGAPIDSALSSDNRFLYVVDSAQGRIAFFRVAGASLHSLGSIAGLPTTLQGIAAQ